MSLINFIEFRQLGDERGSLIALEGGKNIPFNIKRMYYIFDTKEGESRGFHAHIKLQQVAICVSGNCSFVLDDGRSREEVVLDNPARGLVIGNMIWREMHNFSSGCVLMVLASEYYDERDYIRNYNDFISVVKN